MENEITKARVLIIDDEEIVRDDIEGILVPKHMQQSLVKKDASTILFEGDEDEEILMRVQRRSMPVFSVDKAINGMNGLEKVKKSLLQNEPYSVIFLDMRMPGWDGLETAAHIRSIDTKAEIIIVTAYSDRSIEEIVSQAGQNVGYLCKPYASEEILQQANKAIADYNKLRSLEKLIAAISNIQRSEIDLTSLLQNVLDQLATYIGSVEAVIGKVHESNGYQELFYFGSGEKKIDFDKLKSIISSVGFNQQEVFQVEELIFVKLEEYSIVALLNKKYKLKTEQLYLLKLFVQNAAKAIKNAELHEALLQKEKLSAVGKALSMLIHDLQSPIKNISICTASIREEGIHSEWLDIIDQSSERASEIFDDFLDFIRDTPLNLLPVSVDQLVSDGIALANIRSEIKNIDITKNIEQGLFVSGDMSKLKRIIMNLVNNAVDVLKDERVQNAKISILAAKSEDEVVIEIKDNGPGIPSKIISTVFDAFVTSNKSNGTGLGLAIAKQYVEAHKGTISVVNDDGAQFTIRLPLSI